jgi:hypothetical protein
MAQSWKRDSHSRCFSDGCLDGIIYIINQLMAAEQHVRFQPIIKSDHTTEFRFREMTSVLSYRFGHLRTKVFTTNDMETLE